MVLKVGRSEQVFEQIAKVVPGGINTSIRALDPPLVFERASGATITDADGQTYIDYHCAFGPIILGHCHPAVTRRAFEAAQQTDLFGVGSTPLEGELARKIVQHVPSAEQILFCNSGSEATYHAIRLARAVTGRKRVVKFQGCYHGWHDYLAMNVISAPDRVGRSDPLSAGSLPEAIAQTTILPFNDQDALERTVGQQGNEIAAVILEPIPHNIGCVLPERDFLLALRQLTRQRGILLIFDEIVTGFRHTLGGYQSICGVTPDLTTLGKAIANGYPLAALAGRRELMQRFNTAPGGDVFFGGTYNAHPIALAAGVATVEELEKPGVYDRLFAQGERIRKALAETIDRLGLPARAVGFGSVWLVYFLTGEVRSYTDLLKNDTAADLAFRRGLVARGVFSMPLALKRNHLTTSHTDEHVHRTLEAAEDVLRLISQRKPTA